jgi:hypothetical protein
VDGLDGLGFTRVDGFIFTDAKPNKTRGLMLVYAGHQGFQLGGRILYLQYITTALHLLCLDILVFNWVDGFIFTAAKPNKTRGLMLVYAGHPGFYQGGRDLYLRKIFFSIDNNPNI